MSERDSLFQYRRLFARHPLSGKRLWRLRLEIWWQMRHPEDGPYGDWRDRPGNYGE